MDWIGHLNMGLGHSSNTYYKSIKIIDTIFSLIDFAMPNKTMIIFAAFYLASKFD